MTDTTRHPENPTAGGTPADDGSDSPLVAAHPQSTEPPATSGSSQDAPATDTAGLAAERDRLRSEDARRDTGHAGDTGAEHGAHDNRDDRLHGSGSGQQLLARDDSDKLTAQLQHAVAGFVDTPREAVAEADQVLQELTERVTHAVTERRRTLRRSWQAAETGEGGGTAATDTEQLRLALRDYRQLAERLLHV
ncbi:hypothetical protein HCJ93_20370 [Streptomyces sp. SBST2-5]|uniref:Uncharacterized protein n=1 Tax=Streptomyces composti TaxID=2720025 RepID=A0ABX1ACH2_9ACTN|nr:hypothetical protein [Streptomyces composti]NJP52344.1 hypothetical protein [Streptomyces composti]